LRTGAAIAGAAIILLAGCPKRNDRPAAAESDEPVRLEVVVPRSADGAAIEHTLRISEPATHYIEVQSVFPSAGADELVLAMAVWTPGSYLVREYSRHIERVSATTLDAKPLVITKTRKNRWRIRTGGADRVVVRYRLYAFEMTVRTNFVDADVAVINGAATYLVPPDQRDRAHDVRIELPKGYRDLATALPPHPGKDARRFLAPNYDVLVDSPVVAGTGDLREFRIDEVPHVLASFGGDRMWDNQRAAADVERLVRTQVAFWKVIPYSRYVFLNVLYNGGGGLEHKASTLMMSSPLMIRKRADYIRWLGLVSHELFHTWNVKRMRPRALGPFDYENEIYTRSLWIAEGITSYYDDLLLVRSGLMTQTEYFTSLSRQIESIEKRAGRKVQSLSMASYDAWIKYYRRNENSANSQTSYYRKGAVVAFLLDAAIRKASYGKSSLDDVMRQAYAQFAGDKGFTTAQFRALVSKVATTDMSDFFRRYVDGTAPLDYEPALAYYGLHFEPADPDEELDSVAKEKPGWLGAEIRAQHGRLVVAVVPRGTPAEKAGLNVNDEILAIDGYRVLNDLAARLERYRPSQKIEITVSRRGRLRTLNAELQQKPEKSYNVAVAIDPNGAQRMRLRRWLAVPPKKSP
jgi:predicted metalloprotease with PDZ domain